MATYADVAVLAARKLGYDFSAAPRDAWANAAAEAFPNSPSMRAKGCPQTIFLALCASGAVTGVAATGAVRDSENVRHARDCLTLLEKNPSYVGMEPRELWALITHASGKAYNQQMHVVLGLAKAGLLITARAKQTTI
ncbi:DUF6979 family protein [Massilia eurypsychrophila]|uniref:DUF6979 family protein n=1 Tax=Massilia eurypsychrophila TaxID=1485217 RepID=UPI001034F7E4|nr:hypothetical protein [Massilia eurypsychrophila]